MKKILLFLLCAGLLCGCGVNEPDSADTSSKLEQFIENETNLDGVISAFLLEDNRNGYHKGECCGEGHLILGREENGGKTIVYLLTMYGEYGFTNDKFIKVSGSGVIPAVMTLSKTENGYVGETIKYPADGAGYTDSIKEMFPVEYHDRVLNDSHGFYDELKSQEQVYAKEYLEKIGRNAEVAEYADLDTKVLTYYGIPVETSNMLINYEGLENYPLFVGKEEKTENGERFVYEVSVNEETKEITYKKYSFGNPHDIKEKIVFDKNGNKIEEQR